MKICGFKRCDKKVRSNKPHAKFCSEPCSNAERQRRYRRRQKLRAARAKRAS